MEINSGNSNMELELQGEQNFFRKKSFNQSQIDAIFHSYEDLKEKTLTEIEGDGIELNGFKKTKKSHSHSTQSHSNEEDTPNEN